MKSVLAVVMRPTPDQGPERPARERVASQSRGARTALDASAELAGAGAREWKKDADDAPLASGGWHWSISHDAFWTAAVVDRTRVGVDLERVSERRPEIVDATCSSAERALFEAFDAHSFTRLWTAKEAILKSVGIGLGALSRCLLVERPRPASMLLTFDARPCLVQQHFHAEHVFSVYRPGLEWSVKWYPTH